MMPALWSYDLDVAYALAQGLPSTLSPCIFIG